MIGRYDHYKSDDNYLDCRRLLLQAHADPTIETGPYHSYKDMITRGYDTIVYSKMVLNAS